MAEEREKAQTGRERRGSDAGPEDFAAVQEPEWEAGEIARREGRPADGAVVQDDPEPQYGNAVSPDAMDSNEHLTLLAVYEDLTGADSARDELQRQGFAVQAVARRGDGPEQGTPPVVTGPGYGLSARDENPPAGQERLGAGVAVGATVGGTLGLLASTYVFPMAGPMVATGPLISTLAGAGLGSMLGGMIEYGATDKDSTVYAGQVRRGGVILLARVHQQDADEARAVLNRWGALEIRVL